MNLCNTQRKCLNQPVNYQSVPGDQVIQTEWCNAIAFNKESTIMIAGSEEKIKVFEFKFGRLKQISLACEHIGYITALYCMKKSNEFISGSNDNSIRIWGMNTHRQCYFKQWLKNGHSLCVNCIVMNRNEDLIVSCSDDQKIKFWTQKKGLECSQTLTNHTDEVKSISLNDSESQLVSCGFDKQIIIYQQRKNKQWERIQTIKVDTKGSRLCFIGDNLITFQPYRKETMLIFELNLEARLFNKGKDVKVEIYFGCNDYFPQVFNQQKQILMSKNGEIVHLMRKQSDADFVIDQTLKFGTANVFGTMTDDGEYLVTWDMESKQFNVRKQQH